MRGVAIRVYQASRRELPAFLLSPLPCVEVIWLGRNATAVTRAFNALAGKYFGDMVQENLYLRRSLRQAQIQLGHSEQLTVEDLFVTLRHNLALGLLTRAQATSRLPATATEAQINAEARRLLGQAALKRDLQEEGVQAVRKKPQIFS